MNQLQSRAIGHQVCVDGPDIGGSGFVVVQLARDGPVDRLSQLGEALEFLGRDVKRCSHEPRFQSPSLHVFGGNQELFRLRSTPFTRAHKVQCGVTADENKTHVTILTGDATHHKLK